MTHLITLTCLDYQIYWHTLCLAYVLQSAPENTTTLSAYTRQNVNMRSERENRSVHSIFCTLLPNLQRKSQPSDR